MEIKKVKEFIGRELQDLSNSCGSSRGFGSGSGSGSGFGFDFYSDCGSGSGSGSGSGLDFGFGHGSGRGSGYGRDSGSGYGSGFFTRKISTFCGDPVERIDGIPTIFYQIRGGIAKCGILNDDLTVTPCYVARRETPRGILFAHGSTLANAVSALNIKIFSTSDTKKIIKLLWETFNKTDKFPNQLLFDWRNKLAGSCRMEREYLIKSHRIDLKGESTVAEFIEKTEGDYGGEIIARLKGGFQ